MAEILDCKVVAESIREQCLAEADALKAKGITPKLGMVRVGEKGPDLAYQRGATSTMEGAGIATEVFAFDADISQDDYIAEFRKINADPAVHGILPFRPLDNIDENVAIGQELNPLKDVDACTVGNMGKLVVNDPTGLHPCTAKAIEEIMDFYKDKIIEVRKANDPSYEYKEGDDYATGLKVCIVNNSNVIGKPLAMYLTNRFAVVSIVHHLTSMEDRIKLAADADVLVTAVPFKNTVPGDMVKPGAVVIDASIIREKVFDENGEPVMNEKTGRQKIQTVGCLTDDAKEKAGYVTPVPGMGSVTSALLAKNVILACKLQNNID